MTVLGAQSAKFRKQFTTSESLQDAGAADIGRLAGVTKFKIIEPSKTAVAARRGTDHLIDTKKAL